VSLTVWFALALALIFGVQAIAISTPSITMWIGISCLILHIILGPTISFFFPALAPSGSKKVMVWQILLRGFLACIAIFTAIMLTLVDDIAAGFASTFPAIFCTTMVSLWLSQDSSVTVGAVGPLIVGSTAVSIYACLFYGSVVLLKSYFDKIATIALATVISYIITIFGCSLPAFYINKCAIREVTVEYVEDETTTIIHKVNQKT